MQQSTEIIIIGAFHLLLLVTAIYLITYLRICYRFPYAWEDVLILVTQIANLAFLLHYTVSCIENKNVESPDYSERWLIIVQCVFVLLLLLRLFRLYHNGQERRRKLLTPQSIHETIDHLAGGICFFTPSGRPILTNRKLNELIFQLTNHTVINAQNTWEELQVLEAANGCVNLDKPRMNQEHLGQAEDDCLYFSFPDNSIWRFRRNELTDRSPHFIQLEASEISDLYRYSRELYSNNRRLAEQYTRQQKLLADIVDVNNKKEILSMKMRIHDDLGRSILTTKQHLLAHTLSEQLPNLVEIWGNTIRRMEDFTQLSSNEEVASPELELLQASNMIGCRINFYGSRPSERKTVLLLYAAVREALTNAVRHANANQLDVIIQPGIQLGGRLGDGNIGRDIDADNRSYHVEISDNGTVPVMNLAEGSGLSNLRRRLEQEGATLQIILKGGVALVVELPAK